MDVFAEEFDVAALLRDVGTTVETLVRKKNNVLTINDAGDLGTMRSDVVKLRQCLFNLLSNASKFTENGTITVSAVRISDPAGVEWIDFRVMDTGIGMTPEQLERMFQRFSQADETTNPEVWGHRTGPRHHARILSPDGRRTFMWRPNRAREAPS